MVTALKPEHLRRYKQVAGLLARHGRGDLLRDTGLVEASAEDDGADAQRLADDLEALGPTYIKLGQLLSTRADLLPGPYLDALSRLQDQVDPLPFATVEQVLSEDLELPARAVFVEIGEEPIAAASLAQVHAKEFVERLPSRMNRIMDTVAEGQLEVKVDAVDEHELMRMAQKVANRVTAGLVLAALIVGASLLMQVDVEPRLFGYPALAIVLFLAAAAAGFGLLLSILFSDEHGHR